MEVESAIDVSKYMYPCKVIKGGMYGRNNTGLTAAFIVITLIKFVHCIHNQLRM